MQLVKEILPYGSCPMCSELCSCFHCKKYEKYFYAKLINIFYIDNISVLIDDFITYNDKCNVYSINVNGKKYNGEHCVEQQINPIYVNQNKIAMTKINDDMETKWLNYEIKRGDVVKLYKNGGGYNHNNNGMFFFDGNKLILPLMDDDPHRSNIPEIFNCVTEFNPGYWSNIYCWSYLTYLDMTPYLQEINNNYKNTAVYSIRCRPIHGIHWSYFKHMNKLILIYTDTSCYDASDVLEYGSKYYKENYNNVLEIYIKNNNLCIYHVGHLDIIVDLVEHTGMIADYILNLDTLYFEHLMGNEGNTSDDDVYDEDEHDEGYVYDV